MIQTAIIVHILSKYLIQFLLGISSVINCSQSSIFHSCSSWKLQQRIIIYFYHVYSKAKVKLTYKRKLLTHKQSDTHHLF